MFFRTEYNYDTDQASLDSGFECKDASLTIQSMAEDADINVIVKRFGISGQLPTAINPPSYGDFDGITDYHTALNVIRRADESFMTLPADIRAKFNNDAGSFVQFCQQGGTLDELSKLGMGEQTRPSSDSNVDSSAAGASPASNSPA